MDKHYNTLKAQTTGEFEIKELFDQEFLVVPVVAMIEGVRFGANADGDGELGLTEEFAKFVEGWNGRPVVNNHPTVQGQFVSANSPAILEEFGLGTTMNSFLDGDSLVMEAWLSLSLRDESEESETMFTRLEAGEVIEVSVGFFTDVEATTGAFDGEEFQGIWRNIVPDHLAFLEEDLTGACSIEDGCGAARNDTSIQTQSKGEPKMLRFITGAKKKPATRHQKNMPAKDKSFVELSKLAVETLAVEALPEDLLSGDVRTSLETILIKEHNFVFVLGFTPTHAVFEIFSESENRWMLLQQEFTMDNDGNTTFTSEAEEVKLLTRIIPLDKHDPEEDEKKMNTNLNQPNEDKTMDPIKAKVQEGEEAPAETPETETPEAAEAPAEEAAEETTPEEAPAEEAEAPAETPEATPETEPTEEATDEPSTLSEFIKTAPEGMRNELEESIKVHSTRKEEVIKALQASGKCDFDEKYLKDQTLETLENLNKLAGVQSYAGRLAPNGNEPQANHIEAPKAFERKKANAS